MSNFTMTTGTYVNHEDLLVKISNMAISCGYIVEDYKDNIRGTAMVNKGKRLHLKKDNFFVAIAGASNANPTWIAGADTYSTNSIKSLMLSITSTSSKDLTSWEASENRNNIKTCQIGQNNNYWFFKKNEGFLLVVQMSARQFGFLNMLQVDTYDPANKVFSFGASTAQGATYTAAWLALQPGVTFSGSNNASPGSGTGSQNNHQLLNVNKPFNLNSAYVNHFGATRHIGGTGTYAQWNNFLLLSTADSIMRKSLSLSTGRHAMFPLEVSMTAPDIYTSNFYDPQGIIEDLYIVNFDTYNSAEQFQIENDLFIGFPLFEKTTNKTYTQQYGWGMGICIKIGTV